MLSKVFQSIAEKISDFASCVSLDIHSANTANYLCSNNIVTYIPPNVQRQFYISPILCFKNAQMAKYKSIKIQFHWKPI